MAKFDETNKSKIISKWPRRNTHTFYSENTAISLQIGLRQASGIAPDLGMTFCVFWCESEGTGQDHVLLEEAQNLEWKWFPTTLIKKNGRQNAENRSWQHKCSICNYFNFKYLFLLQHCSNHLVSTAVWAKHRASFNCSCSSCDEGKIYIGCVKWSNMLHNQWKTLHLCSLFDTHTLLPQPPCAALAQAELFNWIQPGDSPVY